MLKFRLYMAAAILPAMLAWFLVTTGLQGIHEASSFKKPADLTYAQFAQQRPREGWFRLKGCVYNLFGVIYEEAKDKGIKDLYIPLVDPSRPEKGGVEASPSIFVHSRDAQLIAAVEEMRALPDDRNAQLQFAGRHRSDAFRVRDIEGMVQAGVDVRGEAKQEVAKLAASSGESLLILDEGRAPRAMGSSQGMLASGIGVAVVAVIGWALFLLNKIARRA